MEKEIIDTIGQDLTMLFFATFYGCVVHFPAHIDKQARTRYTSKHEVDYNALLNKLYGCKQDTTKPRHEQK